MAKFITIPVLDKGNFLVPTDGLAVYYSNPTSILMTVGGQKVQLTGPATFAPSSAESIISAAAAVNGPIIAPVNFLPGVIVTAVNGLNLPV
jgi:hypothetical protein